MDEMQARLTSCFLTVFPDLRTGDIDEATSTNVEGWDSVAGVTLLAVVEEEFGITIVVDDLDRFNSFQGFLGYLRGGGSYDPVENTDNLPLQPADLD